MRLIKLLSLVLCSLVLQLSNAAFAGDKNPCTELRKRCNGDTGRSISWSFENVDVNKEALNYYVKGTCVDGATRHRVTRVGLGNKKPDKVTCNGAKCTCG